MLSAMCTRCMRGAGRCVAEKCLMSEGLLAIQRASDMLCYSFMPQSSIKLIRSLGECLLVRQGHGEGGGSWGQRLSDTSQHSWLPQSWWLWNSFPGIYVWTFPDPPHPPTFIDFKSMPLEPALPSVRHTLRNAIDFSEKPLMMSFFYCMLWNNTCAGLSLSFQFPPFPSCLFSTGALLWGTMTPVFFWPVFRALGGHIRKKKNN